MKLSKSLLALAVAGAMLPAAHATVVFSDTFAGLTAGTTTAQANALKIAGGATFETTATSTTYASTIWSVGGSSGGGVWNMTDYSGSGLNVAASQGSVSDDTKWVNIVGSAQNATLNPLSINIGVLAAGNYQLSFNALNDSINNGSSLAGAPAFTTADVGLSVWASSTGTTSATQDITSLATGWSGYTVNFTSDGTSSTTLKFAGDSQYINVLGIDDVVVTTAASSVPEPESYALFGAGLALMGLMARRRKV